MSLRASTSAAAGLLGRHVRGRARDRAGRAEASAATTRLRFARPAPTSSAVSFARPKSRTFTAPSLPTITLAGFRSRWTMPLRVRGGQRVGHGNRDAQHLAEPHPLSRDQRVEALAAHVLHDDEVDAVGRLDLVDRDDVRMVQRRGRFGFLDKPLAAGLVRHPVVREDLDGDLAAEPRIARAIDLAHPARADEREHFIRAEVRPGGQGHSGSCGRDCSRVTPTSRNPHHGAVARSPVVSRTTQRPKL